MLSNAAKTQYTSRHNTSNAVKLNLEIGFGIPSGKEQNQRKKRINTDYIMPIATLCLSSLYTNRQKRR